MAVTTFFTGGGVGPAGPAGPAGAAGAGAGGASSASNITNPYFQAFKLGGEAGAAPAPVVQDGTGPTAWPLSSENGGADTFQQNFGTALGTNAQTQLQFNKVGAAGKMLATSWLSQPDSLAWEGLGIAVVMDLEGTSGGLGYNVRIGLLQANSGVANNLPRPFVTAWNGGGVDPTWQAGITQAGAITVAIPSGSYGTYVFVTGVPALFAPFHLGIGVWTDGQVAAGGRLRMSRCYIQTSSSSLAPPVKPGDALYGAMCDVRVESSADGNEAPGSVAAGSGFAVIPGGTMGYKFRARKLFDPTATGTNPTNVADVWSPQTGALNNFWDETAVGDVTADIYAVSEDSCIVRNASLSALSDVVRGHILVNADL